MQDLAKLSSLAEAEIEDLEKEGIILRPAEVVEINALAWQVESPESRLLLARGVPVEVGGAVLWPLTIYAGDWFNRVGCRLPGSRLQDAALAYAMAHGRGEKAQLEIGYSRALATVLGWYIRLRCTHEEMAVATAQIIAQDETYEVPPSVNEPDEAEYTTPGDLSAFLAAATKSDPAILERHVAIGYVRAMLAAIIAQNKVDGRASSSDPRIQADRALAYRIEQIRAARKEEAQSNG